MCLVYAYQKDEFPSLNRGPPEMSRGKSVSTIVYRVFDEQDRLLYVGVTGGIFLRLGEHTQRSPWVAYAARITLARYSTREAGEAAEKEAIRTEDPVWNM